VAAHGEDPAQVLDHLAALSDDLERIRVISALVDAHPEDAQTYCSLLPHGISRRRCEEIDGRDHLWVPMPDGTGGESRAGKGPVRSRWIAGDIETSDLIHTRGQSRDFASEVDPHAMAWGRANMAAELGELEQVAKSCAAIQSGSRWRYDCFYSGAVSYVKAWDRAKLSDAVALCGAAGGFRALCLEDAIEILARRSPPSDIGDPLEWAPVLMRAHDLRDALRGQPVAWDAQDRFWAVVAFHSVSKAQAMSGDALETLPPAAVPHLRAAIAAKVLGTMDEEVGLDEAVGLVTAVLERRAASSTGSVSVLVREEIQDLWRVDRDGESHLAAISYLGGSRRTVAADPETDTRLVVLEAGARKRPVWQGMLADGARDRDQRVRWTAVRLAEQLGAAELGTAEASQE